jgi:hypothetical protein
MLNIEHDRFANAGKFRKGALAQATHSAMLPHNIL